jgi:hypothetical protein
MIQNALIDPNVGEKPPKTRVADASSARSMLYTLIDDDQIASYRRAQIQGIIDGNPPYNEQQLKEMGQGDRINVNWGHAGAKIEAAVIPYFDILTSVPSYMTVKTKYGSDMGKREEWSRIITEEAQRALVKTNPTFLTQHQVAVKQLTIHGQGCLYWPDGTDFRARAIEPWSLVVPKGAGVDQDSWEFCYILDEMYCEELYRYIEDTDAAKRGGWDVNQCQQAIMDAKVDEQDQRRPWEWYQKQLKDNALYYSYAKSKVIKVAHMFVKEYDGRISHLIFDRLDGTEFLCEVHSRYKKFSNAFTVFLNGVGNGDYHGVRGLGQALYPWAEAMNRLNNQTVEGAILSGATMFQPNSAKDAEGLKTVQIGPYRILPPGLNLVQVNTTANLQAAMAVAQMFQGQEADQTGSYMPSVAGGGRKKSNKEVEIEIGEKSRLTNTRAEIYLQSLDLHYREVYRRLSNVNILEEDHGGPEAIAFQEACINRGVPTAALIDVESVRATRSIGQGSSAARMEAMKMIGEYLPQLPESNRKRVINANIAAIAGQTGVETFGIPEEIKPEGNDMSIASLENNALQSGGQVLIDPDQNHFVHLNVHLQFAGQIVQAVQQQQIDPRQAAQTITAVLPHLLGHLQYLEQDPTRKDQFDSMNEQTSELMKISDQLNSMAQDLQEREQEAMMQQQEQQGQQQTPQMMVAMNKIQLDQAKFANDAKIKQAKAQHQMALQDRKTAQRLMIDKVKLASKYSSIAP